MRCSNVQCKKHQCKEDAMMFVNNNESWEILGLTATRTTLGVLSMVPLS